MFFILTFEGGLFAFFFKKSLESNYWKIKFKFWFICLSSPLKTLFSLSSLLASSSLFPLLSSFQSSLDSSFLSLSFAFMSAYSTISSTFPLPTLILLGLNWGETERGSVSLITLDLPSFLDIRWSGVLLEISVSSVLWVILSPTEATFGSNLLGVCFFLWLRDPANLESLGCTLIILEGCLLGVSWSKS